MSTQLRLVEPPEPRRRPTRGKAGAAPATTSSTVRRARTAAGARSSRRAASWGDWRLDAGTRRVGRAGVAKARAALDAVVEQADLDQRLRAS